MRWTATFGSALVLVVLAASAARSQTVTITSIDNTTAGQLAIQALVTLPANWTANSVTFEARPPNGGKGEGGEVNATKTAGTDQKGTWRGTINKGIQSGNSYDVQAKLVATDPNGKQHRYYSPVMAGQKVN